MAKGSEEKVIIKVYCCDGQGFGDRDLEEGLNAVLVGRKNYYSELITQDGRHRACDALARDQVRDTVRQHARLAAARARKHQDRAIDVANGLGLFGVQAGQYGFETRQGDVA